jgi:hypothetical protein
MMAMVETRDMARRSGWRRCGRRDGVGGLVIGGVLALAVGMVAGCSPRTAVEVAKVSGTVTLDGKPLANAIVLFQPGDGRPSRGMTGSDGRYQLLYTADRAGAMVGTCGVTISTAIEDEDGRFSPERVPKRYFEPGALTVEVKRRSNVHDFGLTSKPGG